MVVVGDDEIDAELAREQGLAHGGDAAVDGHDDARPVRGELAERLAVEAVALLVAVRDVRADDRAELAERRDGDRRPGDAADVVAPVADDAPASRERTMEALERPVHIAHRRALLRGDPGRQEVGHLRRADAPPGEDPRDERGDTIGDIPDPLCGHDPATLRHEAHPTFKYPALVFAIGLALVSCVPPATGPGASTPGAGGQTRATATANPTIPGLAQAPHAIFGPIRAWYLVPDPAFREDVHLAVTFPDGDPTDGRPRARLRSNGRVVDLVRSRDLPASWQAEMPLDGAPPGDQRIEILVRLRAGTSRTPRTSARSRPPGSSPTARRCRQGRSAGSPGRGRSLRTRSPTGRHTTTRTSPATSRSSRRRRSAATRTATTRARSSRSRAPTCRISPPWGSPRGSGARSPSSPTPGPSTRPSAPRSRRS